ncbi:MAG: DNA recombination protein RmuC [Phycisphaeraceae bacterium]|nr:DNA recombination protein RmuC [Phycisphaeraceae bacterium]
MLPALIVVSVLGLIAIAVCAYLWADRRAAVSRYIQMQAERDEAEQQAETFKQQIVEMAEKLTVFKTRSDGLPDQFKSLAVDVLKQTSEQLVKLNKLTFEGEQKELEGMVKPIQDALEKSSKQLAEIEKERKQDKGGLQEMLTAMAADQKQLRSETANLVKALRRPEVRGRWGELQLKRVAELAGMIDHCDFAEQVATADGKRPDMVVHLPAGRDIVIDAKTPLDAYLSAMESEQDDDRQKHLAAHLRHIEQKVAELSAKSYQSQFKRSPDFVVLFIPGEAFLQAAVQVEPTLIETAMSRGVVIASPCILISLLKAVAIGWQEQKLSENAEQIKQLGIEMHKRIAVFIEHLVRLGRSMTACNGHYNSLVGSLEANLLPHARKFKEFGADSNKELPAEGQVPLIETFVREVTQQVEA